MVIFPFLFFLTSLLTFHKLTAWIARFVNIVIGGTSSDVVGGTQKIGCVVTLAWRRINKLLLSTSES